MASQDWFEKDFYKILGVPKDADEAAIKKAYRKLARQYHPDKNPGDTVAEQKFKEIGEAHSVLSDPTQREEYDAIRQMAAGGARFTAGGPGSAGNGGFEDIFSAFGGGGGGQRVRFNTGGGQGFPGYAGGGGEPDINDILSQMFGGGAGGRAGARSTYRGDDYGDFGGFGADPWTPQGRQTSRPAPPCPSARPSPGRRSPCTTAEGRTHHHQASPPGSRTGRRSGCAARVCPVTQEASPVTSSSRSRSVSIPVFGRDGDNLTVDLPVTFAEATLGATVAVPTLDGEQVKVKDRAGHAQRAGPARQGTWASTARSTPATCSPRSSSPCRRDCPTQPRPLSRRCREGDRRRRPARRALRQGGELTMSAAGIRAR
jgi:molecular chaperone DnaJ